MRDTTMRARDPSNSNTEENVASDSSSDTKYTKNWSGATITSPPSDQSFNSIAGKLTVPEPSIPSGVSTTDGEYSASTWVGIDGSTYKTAILQTGIDITVSTSGKASYSAWYEWYPDLAYDFKLDISAGDVRLSISSFIISTYNS